MEAINQLEYSYFLARSAGGDYRDCIDWAMERLRRNEEGDDSDVIMLAASEEPEEARTFYCAGTVATHASRRRTATCSTRSSPTWRASGQWRAPGRNSSPATTTPSHADTTAPEPDRDHPAR